MLRESWDLYLGLLGLIGPEPDATTVLRSVEKVRTQTNSFKFQKNCFLILALASSANVDTELYKNWSVTVKMKFPEDGGNRTLQNMTLEKNTMFTDTPDITSNLPTYKVHPRTSHEGTVGEQKYSSTLSLSSALEGVGGQLHAPAALPRERPGTHCIGGWVGLRCGTHRLHRDSIPEPSSP